jgi:hypothetical protein
VKIIITITHSLTHSHTTLLESTVCRTPHSKNVTLPTFGRTHTRLQGQVIWFLNKGEALVRRLEEPLSLYLQCFQHHYRSTSNVSNTTTPMVTTSHDSVVHFYPSIIMHFPNIHILNSSMFGLCNGWLGSLPSLRLRSEAWICTSTTLK